MKRTRATTGISTVAAIAAIVAGATACSQSDDTPTSATDTAATSDSEAESTQTPTPMVDFGDEPAVRPRYKQRALRAVGDDLITMVPASLPEGWSTAGGGYQAADPQWWRMEFTAPSGEAVLDQLAGDVDSVLGAHQDSLTSAADVDLSKWGIGTWSQWANGDKTLLAHELKGSVVVVQAPDVDTASDLAKSLLPAEDSRSVDG